MDVNCVMITESSNTDSTGCTLSSSVQPLISKQHALCLEGKVRVLLFRKFAYRPSEPRPMVGSCVPCKGPIPQGRTMVLASEAPKRSTVIRADKLLRDMIRGWCQYVIETHLDHMEGGRTGNVHIV
jgi:hypothetical protein